LKNQVITLFFNARFTCRIPLQMWFTIIFYHVKKHFMHFVNH
jgi:hypothetical protein